VKVAGSGAGKIEDWGSVAEKQQTPEEQQSPLQSRFDCVSEEIVLTSVTDACCVCSERW
jgi:hypothetical protein